MMQKLNFWAEPSPWVYDSGHWFSYPLQYPWTSVLTLPQNASVALLSTFLVKMLNSPKRLLQQMENMTAMKRKWKEEERGKEA